jgi:hypothetical protein
MSKYAYLEDRLPHPNAEGLEVEVPSLLKGLV